MLFIHLANLRVKVKLIVSMPQDILKAFTLYELAYLLWGKIVFMNQALINQKYLQKKKTSFRGLFFLLVMGSRGNHFL